MQAKAPTDDLELPPGLGPEFQELSARSFFGYLDFSKSYFNAFCPLASTIGTGLIVSNYQLIVIV